MLENSAKTYINQVVKETIDNMTGEVLVTEIESIRKLPQTPDFVMTFTQDIGFIANISGAASKLLFGILVKIDRQNEIILVKEVKEAIAEQVGIKLSTINKLVTELYQAKVLLKKDEKSRSAIYTINPYYFGKGKWINVNKLRMLVEYDFVNGKKTFGVETEYIDDKDDYIGQLIEHQDVILEKIEEAREARNSKEIIDIESANCEKEHIETDEKVESSVSALENTLISANDQKQEAEELEKLKLMLKISQLENEKKEAEIKAKDAEIRTLQVEKELRLLKYDDEDGLSLFDGPFLRSSDKNQK